MKIDGYKTRIHDLAQRWRIHLLTEPEKLELETWFRSLGDTSLGSPLEMSVDALEKRLHQLFNNKDGQPDCDDGPPYPFK